MRKSPSFLRVGNGLILLLVALAAPGCGDAFGPSGADRDAIDRGVDANRNVLASNAIRYRDSGIRPATGRAGSAELRVVAALDASGRVVVHAEAGTTLLLGLTKPILSQIQLRGYDRHGRLRFSENDRPGSPEASYHVGGLARGDRIQVQASIQRADLWRTGVVRLDAYVHMAPNLTVSAISAPASAPVGTPVNIAATIRETHGDMGARSDCVLAVDGSDVDRAEGIWVDAGGAVTCLFTHIFESIGTRRLEVRLQSTRPFDFDPSDDAAEADIAITPLSSAEVAYDAWFEDRSFESFGSFTGGYVSADGTSGNDWGFATASEGRTQEARLTGHIGAGVAFPLAEIEVRQRTNGGDVHHRSFTEVAETGSGCAELFVDEPSGHAWVNVCSADDATTLSYARYAGDVTYRSGFYQGFWTGSPPEYVWSWNHGPHEQVGAIVEPGPDYGFLFRLRDGDTEHALEPVVPLAAFEESEVVPQTCTETTDQWGTSYSCTESSESAHGVRGSTASGVMP